MPTRQISPKDTKPEIPLLEVKPASPRDITQGAVDSPRVISRTTTLAQSVEDTSSAATTDTSGVVITGMTITRSYGKKQRVLLTYTGVWSVARGAGEGTATSYFRDVTAGTDITPVISLTMVTAGTTITQSVSMQAVYEVPLRGKREIAAYHKAGDSSTTSTMGQRTFSLSEISHEV